MRPPNSKKLTMMIGGFSRFGAGRSAAPLFRTRKTNTHLFLSEKEKGETAYTPLSQSASSKIQLKSVPQSTGTSTAVPSNLYHHRS